MNIWIKSLAALSLMTGPMLLTASAGAAPVTTLPAPAPAQEALTVLAGRPDSLLPSGTKLLSIRIADGLATANFSHELRDNFTGGDSGETHTVNAILQALGQFPTISRVQILVEGKPVDSLGGLLSLSDPLPVIRTAAPEQTPKRWLHRKYQKNTPAAPAKAQVHSSGTRVL